MTPVRQSAMTDRIMVGAAIVLPIVYALLINLSALHSPPAWDSSASVSPAALTLVDLDFDIWEVANLPGTLEGGPSTHSTSIYTIGLALLLELLGAASGFYVAHLVSIALIGALSAATYLLARERLSIRTSALIAVAASTLPVVIQQSADVYLDLPLAVITTLACWAAARRRFWLTVGLVFVGVAIKTSAVFLLPLILIARPLKTPVRTHIVYAALAGVLAFLPFLPAFLTTERFDTGVTFATQRTLLQSSISMLVLTVDVFLVMAIFVLVIYGRSRQRTRDRITSITAVLVVGFLCAYLGTVLLTGTIAMLPRYWIAVIPAVLVSLPPAAIPSESTADRKWRILVVAGLAVLVLFSIVNRRGDFYPLPDHSFYVVAERSTRAQELLQLHIEATRHTAAIGVPILAGWPEYFRLIYPEMGYVRQSPDNVISGIDGWPTELPDSFALLIEVGYGNPRSDLADMLEARGYELITETLRVGGFETEVIVASR
jgi:hypothetical protein